MPISAQMADGTILEFPDGTDAAVIDRAAQEYVRSAPKGNAGAAPEPVAAVEVPGGSPVSNLPQGVDVRGALGVPADAREPDTMAAVRGFGDVMLLNAADEIGSAIESGQLSGPEYDRLMAENAALRASDDPAARGVGEALGVAGSLFLPAGIAGRVAGLGKQMLTGMATGAGLNAFSGAMAADPGERTQNLEGDAIIGAAAGLVAPALAAGARRVVQAVGGVPQSAADDAIRSTGIDPNALRARAADYYAATGKGARLVDILTPDEAQKFTTLLSRSKGARERVLTTNLTERGELPENLSRQIARAPNATPGTSVALPGQTRSSTVEVRSPGSIRQETKLRGDKEFEAIRNEPVKLRGSDLAYFETAILPNVTLPRVAREKLIDAIERDTLTAGDLDMVRRALGKQARNPVTGALFKNLQKDVEDILGNQVPDATAAVQNYARGMALAEGADVGMQASRPGASFTEVRDNLRALGPAQQPGVAPGTRAGLLDQSAGNPAQSYALARELETNPSFQAQLRASLPPAEADALIAYATAQKQAIDNLTALARIPPDKVDELLSSFEGITDAVVGLGAGAGGAFKAGLVNEIAKAVGLGRGAANKLAADLLEPSRRDRAIELLERAGLPKTGLREIAQGLLISLANTTSTADRATDQ